MTSVKNGPDDYSNRERVICSSSITTLQSSEKIISSLDCSNESKSYSCSEDDSHSIDIKQNDCFVAYDDVYIEKQNDSKSIHSSMLPYTYVQ